MKTLTTRLAELERAAQPPRRFAIYQESLEPGERGMFRRGAGWRGRDDLPPLLTRDQVQQDAAGATVILIEYEDNWRGDGLGFNDAVTRGTDGQAE